MTRVNIEKTITFKDWDKKYFIHVRYCTDTAVTFSILNTLSEIRHNAGCGQRWNGPKISNQRGQQNTAFQPLQRLLRQATQTQTALTLYHFKVAYLLIRYTVTGHRATWAFIWSTIFSRLALSSLPTPDKKKAMSWCKSPVELRESILKW